MLWRMPVDTHEQRIDGWPPPGQPTSYKPEYVELAHNYCLLGATNEVLAGFFGVTRRTIQNWIAVHGRSPTLTSNFRVLINDHSPSVRSFAVSPKGCSPVP